MRDWVERANDPLSAAVEFRYLLFLARGMQMVKDAFFPDALLSLG